MFQREPFNRSEEEALQLTHRRAVLLVKSYDPTPDPAEFDRQVKAELAEREKRQAQKTLAQRKAEYWAFCAENGNTEEQIQRAWDEQMGPS